MFNEDDAAAVVYRSFCSLSFLSRELPDPCLIGYLPCGRRLQSAFSESSFEEKLLLGRPSPVGFRNGSCRSSVFSRGRHKLRRAAGYDAAIPLSQLYQLELPISNLESSGSF